jgi:ABC-type antimicrobial peptide transport system permease subunit
MAAFAGVALVLSALGLFGLLVHLVAQRTHEMGIRLAIGASSTEVARLVLMQGLRVSALGLAIGLLLSALAARGVSSLLYGVRPWDPATWVIATSVLLVVTTGASLVPALRASAINPIRALRRV